MKSLWERIFKRKVEEMVSLDTKISVMTINGKDIPTGSNPVLSLRVGYPIPDAQVELNFNGVKLTVSKQDLVSAVKSING